MGHYEIHWSTVLFFYFHPAGDVIQILQMPVDGGGDAESLQNVDHISCRVL